MRRWAGLVDATTDVRSIHEELIDNAAGEHRFAVAVDVEAAARAPNGA
jgi:hypothetical protein